MKTEWNFIKYKPLIYELVKRDLKIKYRRSFLGYLWSLLNPLLMMCVQALVFTYLYKNNVSNFPVYLICGNIVFGFFNEATNMGMMSVLGNAALIKKVYVPKYIFPVSRVITSFVTMIFSLAAVILVMIFTHAKFHVTILLFPIPLFLLLVFCIGVSLFLSAVVIFFRDVQYLYGVFVMALMYATPIFWPVAALPKKFLPLAQANPLFHYISIFRGLFMEGTLPDLLSLVIGSVWAVIMVFMGLLVFERLQKKFILYI